ncbi:hypothetical protein OBBRIDRAFT_887699 [Obba rivulosa]|uniref:Uncharacterized protein n=1 Tax=Obba rivulosa TaxID=1052685 RepID=A0A8E2B1D6_9APHY|nr:hypothetical protein OBBRIDRAFT_887699 [Obba rivulosa]
MLVEHFFHLFWHLLRCMAPPALYRHWRCLSSIWRRLWRRAFRKQDHRRPPRDGLPEKDPTSGTSDLPQPEPFDAVPPAVPAMLPAVLVRETERSQVEHRKHMNSAGIASTARRGLREVVDSGRDRSLRPTFTPGYYPPTRTWDDQQRRADSGADHRRQIDRTVPSDPARRGPMETLVEEAAETSRHPFRRQPINYTDQPVPGRRRILYPISLVNRYGRRTIVTNVESTYNKIDSTSHNFFLTDVPQGWTAFRHPDGALYFRHSQIPIYTDAYLCDSEIYEEIQRFMTFIMQSMKTKNLELKSTHIECVLELVPRDDGGWRWCYYFVDLSRRLLFWLHPFKLGDDRDFMEIKGVHSGSHIKHWLDSRYWTHWEMFPANRQIPQSVIGEVMGTLTHGALDCMMSADEALITYSAADLQAMLTVTKTALEHPRQVRSQDGTVARLDSDYAVCVVARIMTFFALHRFRNFHGQREARLARNQAIYEQDDQQTLFLKLLSPVLFGAPDVQLRSLKRIWVDRATSFPHWTDFIQKMRSEWFDFLIPATVLLSANVSFLALPNVAPQSVNVKLTAAEIFSYISMTASMGSIILSLLLIRQAGHHLRLRESARKVVHFLRNRRHPTLGMEALAVMYSLPYGLMLWAMITFPIAFSFECFRKHDNVGTFTIAAAWITIAVLIAWCVYIGWETKGLPGWAIKVMKVLGTDKSARDEDSRPLDHEVTV